MSRTLVAYYSRTGHTRELARELAAMIGPEADVEEIFEATPRRGALGWVRSVFEALLRLRPRLHAGVHSPAAYDLVLIGGPIWMGRLAPAVRAYAADAIAPSTRVAYFATQDGPDSAAAWEDLERIGAARAVACHSVRMRAVPTHVRRAELDRFLARARSAQPAAPERRSGATSRHAHG
ncbi:flavodoxin family protein [Cognatilysobacter segetis]|uniref:flavodoxin family protein n=1 Tax=Cognatilysobacter segetis TaxID=2492394 RepID=UPI00105CF1CB|nr:flavodoxin [Lysobacter segetis]